MDIASYLSLFQQAADKLDKRLLDQKQLHVETGVWLDSIVLRLYKQHWVNTPGAKPQTGPAIFFSIWIGIAGIQEHKLFYNIHALKLRKLNGYAITSTTKKITQQLRSCLDNKKVVLYLMLDTIGQTLV